MQEQAVPSRVLLFDGGSLFMHSVQGVLEAEEDLQVVAETGNAKQAVEDAARTGADVALVDADLIGSELPAFVARIKAGNPGCKVLVIVATEEVGLLVEALEAGASGYLTKARVDLGAAPSDEECVPRRHGDSAADVGFAARSARRTEERSRRGVREDSRA